MTAPVRVFCAGAVKAALLPLLSDFERRTGHAAACTFGSTGKLQDAVAAGEPADLVLLNRSSVQRLAEQGRVQAGTIADIGRVGVGLAVRSGAPHPDIATPEALRAALLAAATLSYGDPSHGDSSGIHFAKVLAALGIAEQVRGKTVPAPLGLAVAEYVQQGRVELGATQSSVILACPGIEMVGLLPPLLQHTTTYALGVAAGAAGAGGELAAHLGSDAARKAFAAAGFAQDEPA